MKFNKIILLGGLFLSCSAQAYIDIDVNGFNNTGWFAPLEDESMTTSNCCNYDSETYETNWNASHTGVDIGMDHASTEDDVYAIADGTIIGRRLHCNNIGNGNPITHNLSVILVEHKNSDDNTFIAIYGHTAPDNMTCIGITNKYNEITTNVAVSKGDVIGTLEDYNDTHLHFGIAVDTTVDTLFDGWGRDDEEISDYWKDPETYLTNNKPQVLVPEQAVSESVLQGHWKRYTINSNVEFSNVTIELTGLSNDVDLYVKQGGKTTILDYDCRPYKGGTSVEVCILDMDVSTTIHIGVYGYNEGSFTIKATFETLADIVFNDLESKYSNWFSPSQISQIQGEYYLRSYPNGSYLLEWNGDLWYNIEGSGWTNWGAIKDWF